MPVIKHCYVIEYVTQGQRLPISALISLSFISLLALFLSLAVMGFSYFLCKAAVVREEGLHNSLYEAQINKDVLSLKMFVTVLLPFRKLRRNSD